MPEDAVPILIGIVALFAVFSFVLAWMSVRAK